MQNKSRDLAINLGIYKSCIMTKDLKVIPRFIREIYKSRIMNTSPDAPKKATNQFDRSLSTSPFRRNCRWLIIRSH